VNRPNKVILHCSATPDSPAPKYSVDDIDGWHRERGFDMIGYHYYIDRAGEVFRGRADNHVGAHCKGYNQGSLGVCYEGTRFPTPQQWLAIMNLYRTIKSVHGIEYYAWHCHNEFTPKKVCPGFQAEILQDILSKVTSL